jgi:hypothetical protein
MKDRTQILRPLQFSANKVFDIQNGAQHLLMPDREQFDTTNQQASMCTYQNVSYEKFVIADNYDLFVYLYFLLICLLANNYPSSAHYMIHFQKYTHDKPTVIIISLLKIIKLLNPLWTDSSWHSPM